MRLQNVYDVAPVGRAFLLKFSKTDQKFRLSWKVAREYMRLRLLWKTERASQWFCSQSKRMTVELILIL